MLCLATFFKNNIFSIRYKKNVMKNKIFFLLKFDLFFVVIIQIVVYLIGNSTISKRNADVPSGYCHNIQRQRQSSSIRPERHCNYFTQI